MSGKKQFEVLRWASLFLEKHQREPKVAEYLLQHHLDVSRTTYFMNMQEVVPDEVSEKFAADIRKHVKTGIPLQHLTGYEQFYGRRFTVNHDVLIPRPETEELVMQVINFVKKARQPVRIVDVGTGSGVIAVTLACEIKAQAVLATDVSQAALQVAKRNAQSHDVDITFLQGDFLQPLIDHELSVDMIVSNPPYIAYSEKDSLSDTVREFDPELALFAEEDGLAAYQIIIKQAESVLTESGMLAFEIGHTQGEAVKSLINKSFPQKSVDIIKDMNGKDRIVLAIPII